MIGLKGFRQAPKWRFSPVGPIANSAMFNRAMAIAPASSSRLMTVAVIHRSGGESLELPSHSSWIAQCDEKCPCEQAPLHAAVHGVGRPRMLGRRLSLAKLLLLHQPLLRSSTLPEVSPHASGRLRPHPATSLLHDGWHSLFRLDQPLVLTILHSLTQVPAVPAQHGNRPASYQIG